MIGYQTKNLSASAPPPDSYTVWRRPSGRGRWAVHSSGHASERQAWASVIRERQSGHDFTVTRQGVTPKA